MTSSAVPSLALHELVEWTDAVACDVRAGLYDVQVGQPERWHVRLYADDRVDLWLISWSTDQAAQLHDHGGSSGAFTVVRGTLTEASWVGGAHSSGRLIEHRRHAGDTTVFGPHYVHDVSNRDDEVAVSVHAYSPPLSSMNFYDVDQGRLVTLAHMWTDDPEQELPSDLAHSGQEMPQEQAS